MYKLIATVAIIAAVAQVKGDILCNLNNYPSATHGPINDAIANFLGAPSDANNIGAHSCDLAMCSYGTGINVCNDGDAGIVVTNGAIADALNAALDMCGREGDDGDPINAFQNFVSGYNVLVTGGFSC